MKFTQQGLATESAFYYINGSILFGIIDILVAKNMADGLRASCDRVHSLAAGNTLSVAPDNHVRLQANIFERA